MKYMVPERCNGESHLVGLDSGERIRTAHLFHLAGTF